MPDTADVYVLTSRTHEDHGVALPVCESALLDDTRVALPQNYVPTSVL
jgi:hypothetical protein